MIALSTFDSESASRQMDVTRRSAYSFSCHTIGAEHATTRPQLVACFALALSAVTFGWPVRIGATAAEFAAPSVALNVVKGLQQLVGIGARGGALSPVAELVKPAWRQATRSFHSSNPETRT